MSCLWVPHQRSRSLVNVVKAAGGWWVSVGGGGGCWVEGLQFYAAAIYSPWAGLHDNVPDRPSAMVAPRVAGRGGGGGGGGGPGVPTVATMTLTIQTVVIPEGGFGCSATEVVTQLPGTSLPCKPTFWGCDSFNCRCHGRQLAPDTCSVGGGSAASIWDVVVQPGTVGDKSSP